jgi:2-amino-4-ketopentanoate thiolase alpha subunit
MIKKGTLVEINKVVLNQEERTSNIPDDTKNHPFLMWIKGVLIEDANLGDEVSVLSATKRVETGKLIRVEPYYQHGFGEYVKILDDVKHIIFDETEDL